MTNVLKNTITFNIFRHLNYLNQNNVNLVNILPKVVIRDQEVIEQV